VTTHHDKKEDEEGSDAEDATDVDADAAEAAEDEAEVDAEDATRTSGSPSPSSVAWSRRERSLVSKRSSSFPSPLRKPKSLITS